MQRKNLLSATPVMIYAPETLLRMISADPCKICWQKKLSEPGFDAGDLWPDNVLEQKSIYTRKLQEDKTEMGLVNLV